MSDKAVSRTSKTVIPAAVVGIIAIVVGGAIHGRVTQRWSASNELLKAAEVVEAFPESFGPWRQEKSLEMEDTVAETLQCAGYVTREYFNTETSDRVQLFIIVGPPGPTAVHTPEICYSSRDYEISEDAKKVSLQEDERNHTFWALKLKSRRPGGADRRVHYAWTCDETWRASEAPRYEYGGMPYLYKIQVTGVSKFFREDDTDNFCMRFLADLTQSGWRPKKVDA